MPVAYTFANATNTIPLAQLDTNFASPITIGNTSIQLGNSVSSLGNLTLGNVTITSGNIAFAIPATGGGTGLTSPGSSGNVLTSNGTAWVSTGVAAGSGVTALSFGSTGLTPSTSVGGNVTVAGTLVVGSGGTGLSSLTANSVLLGNGSSTIQFVSPGTTGNVLTSNGTSWLSSAVSGGGSGLTLLATLTPTNGTSAVSVTGLSSYKSIIIISNGITTNSGTYLKFQISSDNGSTYSNGAYFTDAASPSYGVAQIYRTDNSSSTKPFFSVSALSQYASAITTITGVVNAVQIVPNSLTFAGAGNIYIYGMN